MTPDERQLIADLFERMRSFGAIEKDRDAESFIMQAVLATPDAAYKLVQSVLVQENALQEAGARIEALEGEMRQMQSAGAPQRPAASGGFLGGLFGGSKPAPAPQPVQRSASFGQAAAPQGSPWGRQAPQQGGYAPQGYQQPQQPAAGGGFMKSAMATAAGVAGGMLAAGAIRDMMGGGSGSAQAAGSTASTPSSSTSSSGEPVSYEDNTRAEQPDQTDYNYQESNTDESSGWGGGGGGDDIEI